MISFKELIESPPKVHNWGTGAFTSSGLPFKVFEFMSGYLNSKTKSVETGMGITTALFALKGGRHTCISPDSEEIERLKQYAKQKNLFSRIIEKLFS